MPMVDVNENENSMKQFVIQRHEATDSIHWDLMLEGDEQLWTWRIEISPSEVYNKLITAERIFDHPLKFLTYEGSVQNGTGRVKITDKGLLHFEQIETQLITFHLEGKVLKGDFTLRRQKPPFWILQKNKSIRLI